MDNQACKRRENNATRIALHATFVLNNFLLDTFNLIVTSRVQVHVNRPVFRDDVKRTSRV